MKLFHTSDWHLGRMLYGRSLLEDQRWFLRQVFLPAVERERPCCVRWGLCPLCLRSITRSPPWSS